jgi:hypothetical protein
MILLPSFAQQKWGGNGGCSPVVYNPQNVRDKGAEIDESAQSKHEYRLHERPWQ